MKSWGLRFWHVTCKWTCCPQLKTCWDTPSRKQTVAPWTCWDKPLQRWIRGFQPSRAFQASDAGFFRKKNWKLQMQGFFRKNSWKLQMQGFFEKTVESFRCKVFVEKPVESFRCKVFFEKTVESFRCKVFSKTVESFRCKVFSKKTVESFRCKVFSKKQLKASDARFFFPKKKLNASETGCERFNRMCVCWPASQVPMISATWNM